MFWKLLQAQFVIIAVIEKLTGTLETQPLQHHQPRPITQVPAETWEDICDSLYLAKRRILLHVHSAGMSWLMKRAAKWKSDPAGG